MHLFREFFTDASPLAQAAGVLQLAFTVWMAVDAYHRRVEVFWYWIIIFFQPIGSWIYFFAVKFRTMRLLQSRVHSVSEPRLSLEELRYRVERSPSVANRFALAQCLMEKGNSAEAIPLLEAVLAVEPDYCGALHALARCRLTTGEAKQAQPLLETLLRRDYRWSNYRAWRTLIEVHTACNQPLDALAACRELDRHTPSLVTKCLLAQHLIECGHDGEANGLLERALEDYRYTSWRQRFQNRRAAQEAQRLLAETDRLADGSESANAQMTNGLPGKSS